MLFLEIGATQFVKTAIVVEVTDFPVMLTRKNTMMTAIFFRDWTSKTTMSCAHIMSFADSG